ncbi:MAG: ABC transporter permease subunit [Candidatus Bipolaricaulota bacterium]
MRHIGRYVLAMIALVGAWWLASWALYLAHGREVLPTPAQSLTAGFQNIHLLATAFGNSAWRFLLSLVIAFSLGVPLGLLIGFQRRLHQYFSPLVHLTYPIPPVALLMFLYMAFGIGETVKVFVVVVALFFQVLVAAQGAARQIPQSHITSVRSAGASAWQLYRHVVLPATLPSVLTAARVSVGLGITIVFIAEGGVGYQPSAEEGLGALIQEYELFTPSLAMAGVVGLALLGLTFYAGLELLDRWLCRWRHLGGHGEA